MLQKIVKITVAFFLFTLEWENGLCLCFYFTEQNEMGASLAISLRCIGKQSLLRCWGLSEVLFSTQKTSLAVFYPNTRLPECLSKHVVREVTSAIRSKNIRRKKTLPPWSSESPFGTQQGLGQGIRTIVDKTAIWKKRFWCGLLHLTPLKVPGRGTFSIHQSTSPHQYGLVNGNKHHQERRNRDRKGGREKVCGEV